jgi:integration host factor subunit alpha
MSLTKAKIVDALFAKNIFTKTESAQIIDTLFELIKQSLENGEDVLISGFGKFSVKEKHGRRGRNPITGESITLLPGKVVTFKCSGVLRAAMNGEVDQGVRNSSQSRPKKNQTDRRKCQCLPKNSNVNNVTNVV